MPVLVALALVPLVVLLAVVLMPLSLVQRYRVGSSRRQARGWLATLNAVAIGVSTVLFLAGALVTDFWVPRAFAYAAAGVAGGALLGLLGLWLSRWEETPATLHFTPNRWLVLGVTLLLAARIVYGLWRAVHAWQAGAGDGSWLAAAGIAGSLAAGGVVLGYYLVFWAGVRRRVRRRDRPRDASGLWPGLALEIGRELLRRRRARRGAGRGSSGSGRAAGASGRSGL
jgi:hypothetical protein